MQAISRLIEKVRAGYGDSLDEIVTRTAFGNPYSYPPALVDEAAEKLIALEELVELSRKRAKNSPAFADVIRRLDGLK